MEPVSMILSSPPPPPTQTLIQLHPPKSLKPPINKPNYSLKPFSILPKTQLLPSLSLPLAPLPLAPLPSLAAEALIPQPQDKVTLESIVLAVDGFFTRYPFFIAGCTFVWLAVIPLTQEYFRKYKYVAAIDGFRRLREDPGAQLLDIREKKSLVALGSPDLESLGKSVVQVEFDADDEDGFVRNVVASIEDPGSTVLCLLDNFDGNSLRAAELLFKNGGFKEAYAIRGGVRGKNGWLAIQDTLLPRSVHLIPKTKKKKKKTKLSQGENNGGVAQTAEVKGDTSTLGQEIQRADNGHMKNSTIASPIAEISSRSPYPNYPDLRPPSSPTPSKPRS